MRNLDEQYAPDPHDYDVTTAVTRLDRLYPDHSYGPPSRITIDVEYPDHRDCFRVELGADDEAIHGATLELDTIQCREELLNPPAFLLAPDKVFALRLITHELRLITVRTGRPPAGHADHGLGEGPHEPPEPHQPRGSKVDA
jgi:hypothetical protein